MNVESIWKQEPLWYERNLKCKNSIKKINTSGRNKECITFHLCYEYLRIQEFCLSPGGEVCFASFSLTSSLSSKSCYIRFSARTNCNRKNTTEIFKRWQVSPIKPLFNIFCQNTESLIPSKHYWSRSRGLWPQDPGPVFPDPAQFLALDPWSHIARYVTLRDAFFVNLDMFDQTLWILFASDHETL